MTRNEAIELAIHGLQQQKNGHGHTITIFDGRYGTTTNRETNKYYSDCVEAITILEGLKEKEEK